VRRSVDVPRYLKLAAVVLASGIAAAACGSVKMGAAAIAGNQRISAAQLNAQVDNYNSFYAKNRTEVQQLQQNIEQQIQQQLPLSSPAQQVLGWMVTFQVTDRMAQRYGIAVAPQPCSSGQTCVTLAQQQKSLSAIPKASQDAFAAAIGLPPDMLSDLGRYEAIQATVVGVLDGGKPPAAGSTASTELGDRVAASQCRAAKSLGIQINPQFGRLDYNPSILLGMYPVVPAASALSKAASPSPVSTPKPQVTPPC